MPSKSRGGLSKREYAVKTGQKYDSSASSSGGSSKLRAAEKKYEKSLKPTSEETAAENTLNQYQIQADKDIQETQKQAIPEFFVSGQSKNIEERADKISVPLRLQVATLRARREAASNVASAKLKSATDSYNRKLTASKTAASAETTALRNESLKADIAKKKKSLSGSGKSSSTSDWTVIDKERGPTGRLRSTVERNKKTGETRRVPIK
jgi:hypothetical protein